MLALWRCWHQFQLFLVLQIRLLLNWFCPPLLGRLIDCKCLRQQRLNQGWASRWNIWHLRRIFYLEEICSFWGYFFLYLEEICSLLGCVLDLEDICFFLGYFSLFGGYMLLFGIFFSYLEEIRSFWGYFFFIWRWYMLSAKRNWELPSAKKPGWKCTSASKIALEGGLS